MERMITYPSLFEQELFYDEKKTVHEWSILLHDIHIEKRERNFTASLSLCMYAQHGHALKGESP